MPRQKRILSETGLYHVIIRGVDRKTIFLDRTDRTHFLNTIVRIKKECFIEIHAYCLMNNHVHFLLKDTENSLSIFMKRIGISYALYFNKRHDRVGHLFQDRFKSIPIETNEYYLTVFRYIHQNPEKAGQKPFAWTSFDDYRGATKLTDCDFAFDLFGTASALIEFVSNQSEDTRLLEECTSLTISDTEAKDIILETASEVFPITRCEEIQFYNPEIQAILFEKISNKKVSVRQIERLTGIGRSRIDSALKKQRTENSSSLPIL